MARWRDTATLVTLTETLNDEGSPVETRVSQQVYANNMNIGAQSWLAAKAAGLRADFQIEVRKEDYTGQQVVVFGGVECEVERVSTRGGMTRLTLGRRLKDA